MSNHLSRGIAAGFLLIVGLSAGCGGPSSHDDGPVTVPVEDELNGPADNDWKRWLAPPPAGQPQPRFVCERPAYEFGSFWAGSMITHAWEITNVGQAPLRVQLWA